MNSISSFCKVVCVCASHKISPVCWHEILLLAILFILAKCIDRCVRMNRRFYEYGGKLKVDIRSSCSVPVKIIVKRKTDNLIFKLLELKLS